MTSSFDYLCREICLLSAPLPLESSEKGFNPRASMSEGTILKWSPLKRAANDSSQSPFGFAPADYSLIVLHGFKILAAVLKRVSCLREDSRGNIDALQARLKYRIYLIIRIIFGLYSKLPGKDSDYGVPRHQQNFSLAVSAYLKCPSSCNYLVIGFIFLKIVFEVLVTRFGLYFETISV